MQQKRGRHEFSMSEPELLIEYMDRHAEWAVIVALVGGGQEINTGEVGLSGWIDALQSRFTHWDSYFSSDIFVGNYAIGELKEDAFEQSQSVRGLHLATSMRSFRAEHLSNAIHSLVEGDGELAKREVRKIKERYPIKVTRDLERAKSWIKSQRRGNESSGVLASSGALRLKASGLFVRNEIDPRHWFLKPFEDVRSSSFLEDIATEFQVQGLELDWCLVAWGADFRFIKESFEYWQFKGAKWQKRKQLESQNYLKNSYRVLLTRARQGMVIYIPEGDADDQTRPPSYYDGTYNYLLESGIDEL